MLPLLELVGLAAVALVTVALAVRWGRRWSVSGLLLWVAFLLLGGFLGLLTWTLLTTG
jgi:hypothetical protein